MHSIRLSTVIVAGNHNCNPLRLATMNVLIKIPQSQGFIQGGWGQREREKKKRGKGKKEREREGWWVVGSGR